MAYRRAASASLARSRRTTFKASWFHSATLSEPGRTGWALTGPATRAPTRPNATTKATFFTKPPHDCGPDPGRALARPRRPRHAISVVPPGGTGTLPIFVRRYSLHSCHELERAGT